MTAYRVVYLNKERNQSLFKSDTLSGHAVITLADFQDGSGDIGWECECGARGISSNEQWAYSDCARHEYNLQENN